MFNTFIFHRKCRFITWNVSRLFECIIKNKCSKKKKKKKLIDLNSLNCYNIVITMCVRYKRNTFT